MKEKERGEEVRVCGEGWKREGGINLERRMGGGVEIYMKVKEVRRRVCCVSVLKNRYLVVGQRDRKKLDEEV